jgi:hypothetical protein
LVSPLERPSITFCSDAPILAITDLNINNKYDITLLDIQDTDGNNIDFSSITNANPVHFSKTLLGANSTDFVIGGGNIAHNNGIYEKTSGAGWNADVTSSKGFINDGLWLEYQVR